MSQKIGEIVITVLDDHITWDVGDFTLPDVVFWIEFVKTLIYSNVSGSRSIQEVPEPPSAPRPQANPAAARTGVL